jgi:putative DNA primase/helicase
VTPVELICKNNGRNRDENAASPTLARLKGKRFVTMAESDTSGRLDESAIKQYTGGEDVTGRELYQMPITFKPQFTMWLSCNDLPAVRDKSIFASERLRVIEFNRHFSQAEQDKNLKTYFESPEAMKGIFTWLIAGYFKFLRFGLDMPKSLRKVVAEYEKDNDLVLQFLEEKCEQEFGCTTKLKSLYVSYKMWCKSGGYHTCSIKKFSAERLSHPEWCQGKYVGHGIAKMQGVKLKNG